MRKKNPQNAALPCGAGAECGMKSKKKIVSTFVHEAINEKNYAIKEVYEHISERVLANGCIEKKIGISALKKMFEEWMYIFPDHSIEVLELEEQSHAVVLRGIVFAHHVKRFCPTIQDKSGALENPHFIKRLSNIEPKGNQISYPLDIHFLFDGKRIICCDFTILDLTNFFQQLECPGKTEKFPEQSVPCSNFKELIKNLRNSANPPLSQKEVECLCLNLNGFSAKQIGMLMSLSYRTIQGHIQHSFDKLQCFSKCQCLEMMHENRFLPIWRDLFNLLIKQREFDVRK
ncbi:MAG: LuxR C-terminal-related transcriptional regulator [Waddliaceae bacterium]